MPITHQTGAEANLPDAIRHELNWLLTTKPVWKSDSKNGFSVLADRFSVSVEDIADTLSNHWVWHGPPKRLGRRFEALLAGIFEAAENTTLLKQGLVVSDGSQTLGELDYLVQIGESIIHFEVAVKFYAGIGLSESRNDLKHWVGPSCQDCLHRKITHLTTHQLPLANTSFGRQQLRKHNLPRPTEQIGLIYGYLLHPWDQPKAYPPGLNCESPAFWCTHKDYPDALRRLIRPYGSDYGWTPVPRSLWIPTARQAPNIPLIPKGLPKPEQADCYALVSKATPHIEKLRVFLMPDRFPCSAKEFIQRVA